MTQWKQYQLPLSVISGILLFLLAESVTAQESLTRISAAGSTMKETAAVCTDGVDTYFAGSALNSAGNWDVVLARIDGTGDTVWTKQWDLGGDEKVQQLILDENDGLFIALTQWNSDGTVAYLAHWSKRGTLNWHHSFCDGGSRTTAVGLAVLNSGNVVLTFGSEEVGKKRCGVSSMTMNGAVQWVKYIAGEVPIAIDANGNSFAIAARTATEPFSTTFLLFDADGRQTSKDVYVAGEGSAIPVCLRNGKEGFFLGGNMLSDNGAGIPFVLNYSHTGDRHWVILPITAPGQHRLIDLVDYPGGGTVITARKESRTGDADIYLARLNPDGTSVWAQSFNRPGSAVDTHPPLFAGISGGRQEGNAIALYWPPARDDVSTRDEITYNIFASTLPGRQDFSSPTLRIKGDVSVSLAGLASAGSYYFVVRAVDAFGNEDTNRREIVINASSSESTQTMQSRR
ncbi:MAG: hypothetical protein WBQ23_02570 [Bacteroidota bacterium]